MRKIITAGLLIPLVFFMQGLAQNPLPKQPIIPASRIVPVEPPPGKLRDGATLPGPAQPIFYSAHRAMDWLKLANKPDGRFVYGFLPALRVPMDGDNFLSQAGATFALARSARYFRNEAATAVARQAALSLLMDTQVDAKDPTLRFTAAPPRLVNRLASLGWLVLAIHELDSPGKDLLEQADQLCNYLRKQQRGDGSLVFCEGDEASNTSQSETGIHCAGTALHALVRSHKQRPAEWKIDAVRKALSYYQRHWQTNKDLAMAVSHTPAYAEAYLLTREPAFAEAVFAMNDWLIGLQYQEDHDSSRSHWLGGFGRIANGKQVTAAPDISSALPAVSLAEACRVAKHAGDLPRLQRYERALMLNLHFLMGLQYSSAKVQHFVENYRPAILGAFYGSHQDGNVKLDYTQFALTAMVQYLDAVIE